MVGAVAQADALQRGAGAAQSLGATQPGVHQRQGDLLEGRGARQQVELLEDEADAAAADARLGVVGQLADVLAAQQVSSAVGRVQTAEDVHQRALAAARRPHDGQELPLAHLQVEAAQGMDDVLAHLIALGDVAHGNHGWFS